MSKRRYYDQKSVVCPQCQQRRPWGEVCQCELYGAADMRPQSGSAARSTRSPSGDWLGLITESEVRRAEK